MWPCGLLQENTDARTYIAVLFRENDKRRHHKRTKSFRRTRTCDAISDQERAYQKGQTLSKNQNIVVTADFECDLILEQLAEHDEIIYEPEQFPGAILRIKEPHKTTVLIFASGKATITGLKSVEQISPTIKKLESILMT